MPNILEFIDKEPLRNSVIKINKIPVEVKAFISANDFVNAVHLIADSAFGENGEYRPDLKTITERYVLIRYFTDIDLGDMSIDEVFKVSQNKWYNDLCERVYIDTNYVLVLETASKIVQNKLDKAETSVDKFVSKISNSLFEDSEIDLNQIKNILDGLKCVDKESFVDAVINRRTKVSKNESETTTDPD